jgi:hypothetical protein
MQDTGSQYPGGATCSVLSHVKLLIGGSMLTNSRPEFSMSKGGGVSKPVERKVIIQHQGLPLFSQPSSRFAFPPVVGGRLEPLCTTNLRPSMYHPPKGSCQLQKPKIQCGPGFVIFLPSFSSPTPLTSTIAARPGTFDTGVPSEAPPRSGSPHRVSAARRAKSRGAGHTMKG